MSLYLIICRLLLALAYVHPLTVYAETLAKSGAALMAGRNVSIAIASTVRRPDESFATWIDHHLRYAQHIMVYLDDPADRPLIEPYCKHRPVTIMDGTQLGEAITPESRIMLRQHINMKHAIKYLLQRGHTWLLHLDSDELYLEPAGQPSFWSSGDHIGMIHFVNHEAVPLSYETPNRFDSCENFRINREDNVQSFMAYKIGKSAVRLGWNVGPHGTHEFEGASGQTITADPEQAMILHYPYPSYRRWRDKFKYYGEFSDYWFNDTMDPITMDFMLRSRDVIQKAERHQDWNIAKEFFSHQIPGPAEMADKISQGKVRKFFPLSPP